MSLCEWIYNTLQCRHKMVHPAFVKYMLVDDAAVGSDDSDCESGGEPDEYVHDDFCVNDHDIVYASDADQSDIENFAYAQDPLAELENQQFMNKLKKKKKERRKLYKETADRMIQQHMEELQTQKTGKKRKKIIAKEEEDDDEESNELETIIHNNSSELQEPMASSGAETVVIGELEQMDYVDQQVTTTSTIERIGVIRSTVPRSGVDYIDRLPKQSTLTVSTKQETISNVNGHVKITDDDWVIGDQFSLQIPKTEEGDLWAIETLGHLVVFHDGRPDIDECWTRDYSTCKSLTRTGVYEIFILGREKKAYHVSRRSAEKIEAKLSNSERKQRRRQAITLNNQIITEPSKRIELILPQSLYHNYNKSITSGTPLPEDTYQNKVQSFMVTNLLQNPKLSVENAMGHLEDAEEKWKKWYEESDGNCGAAWNLAKQYFSKEVCHTLLINYIITNPNVYKYFTSELTKRKHSDSS